MRLIFGIVFVLMGILMVEGHRDDNHRGNNRRGDRHRVGSNSCQCNRCECDRSKSDSSDSDSSDCGSDEGNSNVLCGTRVCGLDESCVKCSCEAVCAPIQQICNELFIEGCKRCQCNKGFLRTGTTGCTPEEKCLLRG